MPIRSDIYMPELHAALSQLGSELLVDTMNNLEDRLLNAYPQNDAVATYAPKITSQITEIRWSQQTSMELFARYRALYGFKNLTTSFLGKTVQLLELKPPVPADELRLPASTIQVPGSFYFHRLRKSLLIGCAQGTQLEVLQLRVEGKKPMSAHDFNNGFLKRAQTLQFTQNKQVIC
ncbi:methionyl-tRNA formyltransferase, mitochondrial isoform X3 [Drosophila hydei]|nr:methionyl-tRNA formyltransferase, mitochondrial isoform X3 [Drosophila hydei]